MTDRKKVIIAVILVLVFGFILYLPTRQTRTPLGVPERCVQTSSGPLGAVICTNTDTPAVATPNQTVTLTSIPPITSQTPTLISTSIGGGLPTYTPAANTSTSTKTNTPTITPVPFTATSTQTPTVTNTPIATNIAYPHLANYYLPGSIGSNASSLAKWDLVVAQAGTANVPAFATMRATNPNIKILDYVASEEQTINLDSPRPDDPSTFNALWNLTNASGVKLKHAGNNVYDLSSVDPTPRWIEQLSAWTVAHLYNQRGDGIFYDNAWDTVDWLPNIAPNTGGIDTDHNGQDDISQWSGTSTLNTTWENGVIALMNETRNGWNSNSIIVGNGGAHANAYNNGRMNEGFELNYSNGTGGFGWVANLTDYMNWNSSHYGNNYYILNWSSSLETNSLGTPVPDLGQADYQGMRFHLGTTLLGDGYFSFDDSQSNHAQLWWYDEYSVDYASGNPTLDATKKGYLGFPVANYTVIGGTVYRRTFDNGIVLVNPTSSDVSVALGVDFRYINGTQDSAHNKGGTTTGATIVVPAKDSYILLNLNTSTSTSTATSTKTNTPTFTSTPTATKTFTATPTKTNTIAGGGPTKTPIGLGVRTTNDNEFQNPYPLINHPKNAQGWDIDYVHDNSLSTLGSYAAASGKGTVVPMLQVNPANATTVTAGGNSDILPGVKTAVANNIQFVYVNQEGPACGDLQRDEKQMYQTVTAYNRSNGTNLIFFYAPTVHQIRNNCSNLSINADWIMIQTEAMQGTPGFLQNVDSVNQTVLSYNTRVIIVDQVSVNPPYTNPTGQNGFLIQPSEVEADIDGLSDKRTMSVPSQSVNIFYHAVTLQPTITAAPNGPNIDSETVVLTVINHYRP